MDDAEFRSLHRRELADDRINGASQLARKALDSLAEFSGSCSAEEPEELQESLLEFAEELQYARPNMAPIHNLVERWADRVAGLEPKTTAELRRDGAALAQELSDGSIHAVAAAAHEAARLIGPGATIITHSLSSTVLEAFRSLAAADVSAIVTESRPGLEGRNQARYLDKAHIPVSFITDAQLGHFSRIADAALVGADTLLGDGALVNKAGTYLLALAARDCSIPFYVCCESFKQVPYGAASFELETLDPRELDAPRGRYITPLNVYFDITPARLIDAWIDETGVRYAARAESDQN